jgi:hypothetical protein
MADNSRRGWWQFSLRTVLWVMLVIGVGLTAHRRGYDAGHKTGFASGVNEGLNRRRVVGQSYAKVYSVTELLGDADANSTASVTGEDLVRDLCATVLPRTWSQQGGNAAAAMMEKGKSLVVSHDQEGHDRVAEYLDEKRQISSKMLLTAAK